jgi:Tfp pilus assembly protein PilX
MRLLHTPTSARRRDHREAGFAMPAAIIVLFIITALTAAAVTVATQTSSSTTRDDSVKAELEAAEAGLNIASYRLSQLKPGETECINEGKDVQATKGSQAARCKDGSESLGNGATFQYWTTLPLKAGETCAGRTVETLSGITQRCVTSRGKVNGVEPAVRLQARVTATGGGSLFPINGMFGSEEVEVANNAVVKAPVGSNHKVLLKNGSSTESVVLGKSAPANQPEVLNGASSGPVTREPTDISLVQVSTGYSATENQNFRIENGLKSPKEEPWDESSGVSYNRATRTLTINNGGSLTLGGEVYNFCNFTMALNAKLKLASGVKTRVYIDSANDENSECKAGESGKLTLSNGSDIENPSKDPTTFQIYVYDGSGGTAELSNNSIFYGTIYAPGSAVAINNNSEFFGAVAGRTVFLGAGKSTFSSDKRVESISAPTVGLYHRAAWEQCTPGSGPTEGC